MQLLGFLCCKIRPGGQCLLDDFRFGILCNIPQGEHLPPAADQGQGGAGFACSAGSADAVDIVLVVLGQIVVEHQVDAVYVNAPGSHIRCHQNTDPAAFECVHHLGALHLLHISVKPCRLDALVAKCLCQLIHRALGVTEHHSGFGFVCQQQQPECIRLSAHGSLVIVLLNSIHSPVLCGDFDDCRILLELFCDCHNFRGHGSGKQYSLPFFRHSGQDGLNVLPEAHVEHFICLVQDHGFQILQLEGAPVHVIHNPSRCAHYNVCATFQITNLPIHAGAPIYGTGSYPGHEPGKLFQFLACLHGKLTGGAEDQNLNRAGILLRDGFHCRNAECGSLAGAGV